MNQLSLLSIAASDPAPVSVTAERKRFQRQRKKETNIRIGRVL
jgi:hypothetical protein